MEVHFVNVSATGAETVLAVFLTLIAVRGDAHAPQAPYIVDDIASVSGQRVRRPSRSNRCQSPTGNWLVITIDA